MSEGENARDTKFMGFAKALNKEITNLSLDLFVREGVMDAETVDREYEMLIARRAYDLVEHVYQFQCFDHLQWTVEHTPDLTELPKRN